MRLRLSQCWVGWPRARDSVESGQALGHCSGMGGVLMGDGQRAEGWPGF